MMLSIPLFSTPLLIAAVLMGLGFLIAPVSIRPGVAGIGLGTVIMGAVVLINGIPEEFKVQSIFFFGLTVLVGAWMVFIAVRHPA